jgi:hypothetical protein
MINLEEIIKVMVSDLKLASSEQSEFNNQFMQLFVFNLLLDIPGQYQNDVKNLLNDKGAIDQKVLTEKLVSFGINGKEAKSILDESVRRSLSEVVEKYSDVLSNETKLKLQKYL